MGTILFLILIIFILSQNVSATNRYALIIGHNNGGKSVEVLRYAEYDAQRFSNLLIDLGGFERSNIILLQHTDSLSVATALEKLYVKFRDSVQKDNSLFLLYYSGHANSQGFLLGEQVFPFERFQWYLDSIKAGIRIGIFDACHSGTVTRFKGGKAAEPFYLKNQRRIEGQVIIASSSANELAQESETLKGSIFSHHWFNALRGSADVSGDGQVSINEAYQYAYRKTIETTALSGAQPQHPQYRFNIHGQGDIVLTSLSRGTGVFFDESFEGKFIIISDGYSDIYADFVRKRGQQTFINLPEGAYTVINVYGAETRIHNFNLTRNTVYKIKKDVLVPNAIAMTRFKGSNPEISKSLEIKTTPLSVYSWGVGLGTVFGLNSELRNRQAFLKFDWANSYYINDNTNLCFGMYWILFGANLGGYVGLDYSWKTPVFQPFAGLSIGAANFEKKNAPLTETMGPALSAYLGFKRDISRRLEMKLEIPYTVVLNKTTDRSIGIDVKVMIYGPYRDVKKIHFMP